MKATEELRNALGQAHYDRMRLAMQPTWFLPTWDKLSEATREAYRQRIDYLIPALTHLLAPRLEKVS